MRWDKMGWAKERGGLGFRDLEWFNLALLAKQGWRLIQNPNSLVAKILKEKYHPNAMFLEAHMGRRPSYIWRSFWNSKKLLADGLIWRVGDGSQIRIWRDRWAPVANGGLIQSPVRILEEGAKVSELLDRDTNWWNYSLIHEVFSAEEAELICSLPVCPSRGEDKLIWQHNKTGEYTVRSGYHFAKGKFEADMGSCSNSDNNRMLWKAIWGINAPRAAKTFVWKACSEILPTKEKLFRKHVTQDPLCPICCLEVETIMHALWDCPSAKDVWAECPSRLQKCSHVAADFMSLMDYLLERCTAEEVKLGVIVARQIWHRRNQVVFGGKFTSPKEILTTAQSQLESVCEAEQHLLTKRRLIRTPEVAIWQKPPMGICKLNWDAAVDSQGRRIGIGAIVRDHNGEVLAMLCETMAFINDPVTAEALAARRGAELCQSLGILKLVLEGDALQIVQALRSTGDRWCPYGLIIEDTRRMLRNFQECSVNHVRREANVEAHKLAKLSFSVGENKVWLEDFPISVRF
jgi:hypothetical protein